MSSVLKIKYKPNPRIQMKRSGPILTVKIKPLFVPFFCLNCMAGFVLIEEKTDPSSSLSIISDPVAEITTSSPPSQTLIPFLH